MKRFDRIGFAAALLAGSALVGMPAIAQDASTETQPRIQKEERRLKGSIGSETTVQTPGVGAVQNSTEGQATVETAPGSGQLSGEAETATEATPDQMTREPAQGTAEAPRIEGEANTGVEATPDQQQRAGEVERGADGEPRQPGQDRASDEQPSREITGSIDVSVEQRVEIQNIIREVRVEPVRADFDVRVGISVPQTIELRPLPPRVVRILPAYEGYVFFVLADGRIVIVEPATLEVVYILVA